MRAPEIARRRTARAEVQEYTMSASNARPSIGLAQGARWAVTAAAAVAGAWFSYGFGAQLGGVLFGFIAALNGAVICSLLISSVLARFTRRAPRE
jgi:hypothetical protein